MAKRKTRDSGKQRLWQRWIRLWRSSGLSVRVFCQRHALHESSFYAWRRIFQQRQSPVTPFVPVRIIPDGTLTAAALEVLLRGGRSVRVLPGFDVGTLRQLLAVLEDQPC